MSCLYGKKTLNLGNPCFSTTSSETCLPPAAERYECFLHLLKNAVVKSFRISAITIPRPLIPFD